MSEQNDVSTDDSVNPAQNTTFPSNGGQAHGYLAIPESGSGPGVIVIQEWWGLTDHIVDIANRLAGEGFVALAPDLFGGKTTHDSGEAGRLMSELPVDKAATDLAGAVDYLLGPFRGDLGQDRSRGLLHGWRLRAAAGR